MNTAITEEKVLNMLEKSGVHGMTNLAEGAEVTATFTPDKAPRRVLGRKAPC